VCDEDERVRKLATIAYVVLGVLVASQHDYYAHLTTVSQVLSAVVATALWPLILFGAGLHLNLGRL
jgi:ABC-type anion transport system duplicated permease subunit